MCTHHSPSFPSSEGTAAKAQGWVLWVQSVVVTLVPRDQWVALCVPSVGIFCSVHSFSIQAPTLLSCLNVFFSVFPSSASLPWCLLSQSFLSDPAWLFIDLLSTHISLRLCAGQNSKIFPKIPAPGMHALCNPLCLTCRWAWPNQGNTLKKGLQVSDKSQRDSKLQWMLSVGLERTSYNVVQRIMGWETGWPLRPEHRPLLMANKKEVTHDYKELNFANSQQPFFFQKKTQMSSFLNPWAEDPAKLNRHFWSTDTVIINGCFFNPLYLQ